MYRINLLPEEMTGGITVRNVTETLPGIAWRAVAVVVVLGYGAFLLGLSSARDDLEGKQARLAGLSAEVSAANELKQAREQAEAQVAAWRGVPAGYGNWVGLLEDLNSSMPPGVWFTALTIAPGEGWDRDEPLQPPADTVSIDAAGQSLAAVGMFVQQLQRMPHFTVVVLREIREESNGTFSFKVNMSLAGSGERVAAAE